MIEPAIDLLFRVVGQRVPVDHRYALYAAISRVLGPDSHAEDDVAICPISGVPDGQRGLQLNGRSRLRIRCRLSNLPRLLQLSGRSLELDGHQVRLGVPQALPLNAAAALQADLVTIKGYEEPVSFLEAVRRQLDQLGVQGRPAIPLCNAGAHAGKPARRVLRIKDKTVVGFVLRVNELAAEDSLKLQELGIGGRRHMGCGVFLPMSEEQDPDETQTATG